MDHDMIRSIEVVKISVDTVGLKQLRKYQSVFSAGPSE
jgi:hypothetical protein